MKPTRNPSSFPLAFMILMLTCLGLLTSCVTYTDLNDNEDWPPQQTTNITSERLPSLNLTIRYASVSNGFNFGPLPKKISKEIGRRVARTHRRANLFSDIYNGNAKADITANVYIEGLENSLYIFFPFISGFILPGYITQELKMTTEYLDRRGRPLGSVEKMVKKNTVFHPVLIVAAPFGDYKSDTPRLCENMVKETLLDAHKMGIF